VSAATSDSRRDFREKLILSIFDKLVLGLLIVLAGFVLNVVLQNRQSDQATRAEIAKLRVARVAQVWNALDEHQQAIDSYGPQVVEASKDYLDMVSHAKSRADLRAAHQFDNRVSSRLTQLAVLVGEKSLRILLVLRRNRFWIGEKIYPVYVQYAKKQDQLEDIYLDIANDFNAGANIRDDREGRQDLLEARRAIVRDTGRLKLKSAELRTARLDVFAVMEKLS
jgi:hypothetical protein